jgi:arylsulfatase
VQYYYIFGSRAIYQDGWKASLAYPNSRVIGLTHLNKPFDENNWELYNLNDDYTERLNLAQKYPEKLTELKALFEQQAQSHNLYPLITWDDVWNARIHHTKGAKSIEEEFNKVSTHTTTN